MLAWTCWIIPSCGVSTHLPNRKWTWGRPSSISTLWRCSITNLSSPKCTRIFEWSPSHLGPNSEQSNCHARTIEWDGASTKAIGSSSMENGVQVEPLLCSIRILHWVSAYYSNRRLREYFYPFPYFLLFTLRTMHTFKCGGRDIYIIIRVYN